MRESFRSRPEDPTELRAVSELMAAQIKSPACQIKELKTELAAHRKARFGARSESMDNWLSICRKTPRSKWPPMRKRPLPKMMRPHLPNAPTIARRCLTTLSGRRRCSHPVMLAAIAVVRSNSSANMFQATSG